LKVERVAFAGTAGQKLAARLDAPDGTPTAYALFAHCFTCGKDVFAATRIAQQLATHGIACLRFDFTGLGSSEGEFANTNFSSNVADLIAAAAHLRESYQAPALLIGHSLGGAAVLAVAGLVPECKAVVTIAAPSDVRHVRHLFGDRTAQIEADGEANVVLAGRPFTIKRQFLLDAEEHNIAAKIAELRRALHLARHGGPPAVRARRCDLRRGPHCGVGGSLPADASVVRIGTPDLTTSVTGVLSQTSASFSCCSGVSGPASVTRRSIRQSLSPLRSASETSTAPMFQS